MAESGIVQPMRTLLEQIRDDAIDEKVGIGQVLRKCLVLADRLGHADFKAWVQRELNGYKVGDEVPPYRQISVTAKGMFVSPAWKIGPVSIPPGAFPDGYELMAVAGKLTLPIAAYPDLITEAGGDAICTPIPAHIFPKIHLFTDMTCIEAHQELAPSQLRGLIETVRNRTLEFVLQLQNESPRAGEEIGQTPAPLETVEQVFNTTIMGNVANLASGSSNFQQQGTINVQPGDLPSLERFLGESGVPALDLVELKRAVEKEPPSPEKTELGPRVASWIGRAAVKLGATFSADLVAKAIAAYYGFPP
jgi:hypothetical protein